MKVRYILFCSFLALTLNVFAQENVYSSFTIPEELTKNANAVVRINNVSTKIESQKKVHINITRIVTVLNEKGNKYVGAIVGYDNYRKIKAIEAHIYDEGGKEIKKIKKKDFIDHSAVDGGTLYTDSRVLFMGYTPIKYPYTVEFTCQIESANTATISTWKPIDSYYLSIEKDTYSLIDEANLGLRFKEKFFDGYDIESQNSSTSLLYSISKVTALKPEDLSPYIADFTPQVMIAVKRFHYNGVNGQASNWQDFGEWIKNALLEGRDGVTNETKQEVLDLVEGVNNPIEKAKLVYKYVQDNTRYISVQVGIGGVQPISAMEVDELKYGDCKGLTNYTQSLLNIVGVESYYSIVQAGKHIVDFDKDFASLEQGNHIILAVPNNDKIFWLDCTSQIHPFGFIGDFTDNRDVLIVKKGGSEILKTTTYLDSTNYQYTQADIKLNADASIVSTVNIKTKGIQYDNRFIIERESRKDIIEYYKEYWDNVNNLEVENYTFNNDKEAIEFTEKVQVSARNYASTNGDNIIFSPNVFNKNSFVPGRYRNRKLPLEIQRGYLDEDNFTYTLPEGYFVGGMPENVVIKNQFGEYSLEFLKTDNKIQYKRRLSISKGKFPKTDYAEYRNFRKKISYLDNSKIILKKVKI